MIEVFENFGLFLLGSAASGFVTYLNARNKHSAKIDSINEKLNEISCQQQTISKSIEVGKIEALTSKINEVISQQEKLTFSSEVIKSDIDIKTWKIKEAVALRRQKTEELYLLVEAMSSDLQDYLKTSADFPDKLKEFNVQNAKIDMLLNLYFSGLEGFSELDSAHKEVRNELTQFALKYPVVGKVAQDTQLIGLQVSYITFFKHLEQFLIRSLNKDSSSQVKAP